jgi:hypothetical protein
MGIGSGRSLAVERTIDRGDQFALLTTKRTSIMGPALVSGQLDVHKVVSPLSGNAR